MDKISEETKATKNFQAIEGIMKNKEYLFDTMMAAIGDLVSIQDTDMRIVYQNEATKRLMGGANEGEFCYKIYQKKDNICEGCPVRETYKDGKNHRSLQTSVLPDGTQRRFELISDALKDEQGKIVAGIEIVRDVEERERAIDEIRNKKDELERMNKLMTGRELKMVALKNEVEELKNKLSGI